MDLNAFLGNTETPRLIFCTGAGLSKDSGIPTFRDANGSGMWDNVSVDAVCNIANFYVNYNLVHSFYSHMRQALPTYQPNEGHDFIARMQKLYGDDRVLHITANVDDLAERAGGTAMHVHGKLTEVVEPYSMTSPDYAVRDIGYADFKPTDGVVSKPNIVMFGESFWFNEGKRQPLYNDLYKVLDSARGKDTFIIIGSSDMVIKWSVLAGLSTASSTLNINPEMHDDDGYFTHNVYAAFNDRIESIEEYITARMGIKETSEHP